MDLDQEFDTQESYRQQKGTQNHTREALKEALKENVVDEPIIKQVFHEREERVIEVMSGTSMRTQISAGRTLVSIQPTDKWEKLSYILCEFERVLEQRKKVKPNNSPVFLYPNGNVRIPVIGTYLNINEAYKALKRLDGDKSQETLPSRHST